MAIYKNNTEVKDIYMIGHGLADPNAVGLQEDVDYVRYEWLKGDGSAYIDTLIKDFTGVTNLAVSAKKIVDSGTASIIGCEGPNANTDRFILDVQYDSQNLRNRLVRYVGNTSNNTIGSSFSISVNFTSNTMQVNNNTYSYTFIPTVLYKTLPLFAKKSTGSAINGRSSGMCISYFRVDSLINLVPCRLLRPIPASLDANNKARQEGEYGMIDLVSKMFYGNVNNSGSFTGEGLIQKKVTFAFFGGKHVYGEMQEGVHIRRYGWLKASSNKNCTMQHYPIRSTNLYFKRVRLSGRNFGYFGTNGYTYHCNSNYNIAIWNNKTKSAQFYDSSSNISIGKVITINCNTNNITIDGRDIPIYGYPIGSVSEMFSDSGGGQTLTSSIIVDGSIRYTPCKLLKAIPAELDANGIARAAGVCGMYDEVNHKFYGNVASSGTFTVEGMAEGYDYEVYQYLIGDGTAYATATVNIYRDTVNTLIIPTSTTPNTIMYSVVSKLGDTENYAELQAFVGNGGVFTVRYTVRVNNQADSNKIDVIDNYVNKTYTIKTTRSGTNYVYYLNGNQVAVSDHGQYEEADMNITPKIIANGCKLGYFSTSGSNNVNLRPCKLLRAIPAELDANGIARSVNECGFIDTRSGKFYGNVNSSGTFSVSDS